MDRRSTATFFGLMFTMAAMVPAANAAPARAACSVTATPSTAQTKIAAAQSGDVVCLEAGVYRGPLRIESKNDVTVRGAGAHETIVAGGDADSLLIFRSRDIVIEDLKLFYGHPSNAYVWRSTNIVFQRVHAGGGSLGIHFDLGSIGRVSESSIYAMDGDGLLTRNASDVAAERNWIFNNGGVGVSTVGNGATTAVTRNIISDNRGPGVFVGQTPCTLLPAAVVEIPDCYLSDLRRFVSSATATLTANVIQSNGSTGIVLFPGTTATMRNNRVWRNVLTGLFVWGASITSEADEFDGNEEHAVEMRAYPDPLKYPQVPMGQRIRAVGRMNNAVIRNSVVLPDTGTLGGGFLAQGANVDVTNSQIYGNRGIGVSYVNTSLGRITGNTIRDNRGSAICIYRAGVVTATDNVIYGNSRDGVGVCHETTP